MTQPAPTVTHGHSRLRANLLLTLTAAIWGFAFVAQRVGAEHMGAFAFNGVRFAIGSLSLLPVIAMLARRASRGGVDLPVETGAAAIPTAVIPAAVIPAAVIPAAVIPGVVAGSVLFVAAALQQAGVESTTAGKASFITGLYIVVVPVLGIALRHHTSRNTWLGVALAVAGLYLLTVTEAFTIGAGDALVLVSALFWAVHILVIGHYVRRVDPLRLSAVQFAVCSLLSLGFAVGTEPAPFSGVGGALVPIAYGGLLAVGVAYTLQVVGQRHAKASHAAIILSTEAVFGAIGGWLILGEDLGPRGYVGCAVMLAGIVVSQLGDTSPS
jgi:drug/metabolite transporter (DMT)-like permease